MGWGIFKTIGKKILKGAEFALPIIEATVPAGSLASKIAKAISHAADAAEENFPTAGSGAEKASFVTIEALKEAEAVSGKNFDSPDSRALIQKAIDADVAVKKAAAQLASTIRDLDAWIKSPHGPAVDDTSDGA